MKIYSYKFHLAFLRVRRVGHNDCQTLQLTGRHGCWDKFSFVSLTTRDVSLYKRFRNKFVSEIFLAQQSVNQSAGRQAWRSPSKSEENRKNCQKWCKTGEATMKGAHTGE